MDENVNEVDEILETDEVVNSIEIDDFDDYDDFEYVEKKGLNSGIKLALLLIIAGISGFLLKDVFLAFANWIIFN